MIQRLLGGLAFCFALLAGTVYAIQHYWSWLNDLKVVAGVQAATAIIVGVPATFFAVFATIASIESAFAARAQTEVSKAQLKAFLRPILVLEKRNEQDRFDRGYGALVVRNAGPGTAFKVRYWFNLTLAQQFPQWVDGDPEARFFSVPPGVGTNIDKPRELTDAANKIDALMIECADASGNFYLCRYELHNWRDGGYTPYHFEGSRADAIKAGEEINAMHHEAIAAEMARPPQSP